MNLINPLVTIGVASYNNERYVIDTLNSINEQTYDNIELIIVDDSSKDKSSEIIEVWVSRCRYSVKFIKNDINLGIPKVCNIILNATSKESKYIALIGSDDVMETDRISKQVAIFETAKSDIAAIFSDMKMIDENARIFNESYIKLIDESDENLFTILSSSREKQLELIIKKNIIPAPSLIQKTEILKKLGGWDESLYFEDWDMNLRIINEGYKFLFIPETLVRYRKSQTSVMAKPNVKYTESLLNIFEKYRSINSEIDTAINEKIAQYALALYMSGGNNSTKWLYKKLKFKFGISNLFYFLLSLSGIEYEQFLKLRTLFK